MKRLMVMFATVLTCGLMVTGCGHSVSDIEEAVKTSMNEKSLGIVEVTLSETGKNTYHGMAKDNDGDLVTIDVTVTDNGDVMWEAKP